MSLILPVDLMPLRVDEHGTIRVGDSRITLDVFLEEYEGGATPEDLVQAFDSLQLADVYAVLAYYLRHREEILTYLRKREEEAVKVSRDVENAGMAWRETKESLLARRAAKEAKGHAPPC